jgi:hypothetical protein
VRTTETEMDREKGKVLLKSYCQFSLHPEWLTRGQWLEVLFSPDLLVSHLKTKPLSLPKHPTKFSPLSLAFEVGSFPIADMSRLGGGSGHIQVTAGATLGWPVHSLSWPSHQAVGMMDPWPQSHVSTGWKNQQQNFNSLSKMPHVFKIKISVF